MWQEIRSSVESEETLLMEWSYACNTCHLATRTCIPFKHSKGSYKSYTRPWNQAQCIWSYLNLNHTEYFSDNKEIEFEFNNRIYLRKLHKTVLNNPRQRKITREIRKHLHQIKTNKYNTKPHLCHDYSFNT